MGHPLVYAFVTAITLSGLLKPTNANSSSEPSSGTSGSAKGLLFRILLVEDNDETAEFIARGVQEAGGSIHLDVSAKAGLITAAVLRALARRQPFAV